MNTTASNRPTPALRRRLYAGLSLLALSLCAPRPAIAEVTLQGLLYAKKMTPKSFAKYFSDFEYQYRVEVQPPEAFLMSETGDCDDYATLADKVLRRHGYRTRLITVRMPGVVHVVCYVEETESYLDFNNRVYWRKTVRCDPDLRSIAKEVARSFRSDWTSVTEFTFHNGVKRLVKTVVKTSKYK